MKAYSEYSQSLAEDIVNIISSPLGTIMSVFAFWSCLLCLQISLISFCKLKIKWVAELSHQEATLVMLGH